jgi:hypothetical protein
VAWNRRAAGLGQNRAFTRQQSGTVVTTLLDRGRCTGTTRTAKGVGELAW